MIDPSIMDDGLVDLTGMVSFHLSTAFYPKFPDGWVEECTPLVVEAIEWCADDEGSETIVWPYWAQPWPAGGEIDDSDDPEGWSYYVKAYAVVEATKTWPLVEHIREA
jgi:hypothetical protein